MMRTRGRKSLVVGLLAAAMLAGSATALAKPIGPTKAVEIGSAVGPEGFHFSWASWLVSDWYRYVAWVPAGTQDTTIYDTKRREPTGTVSGCRPATGSPGVFVVDCGTGTPRLLDARTRVVRGMPGAHPNDRFYDIGRYWAAGDGDDPYCQGTDCPYTEVTVNWHTGKRRVCEDDGYEDCPIYDLDTPAGRRTPYLPAGHQRGYFWVWGDKYGLSLRRVGGQLIAKFGRRCRHDGEICNPELYAGRMSWTLLAAGPQVGGYSIHARRAWRWGVRTACPSQPGSPEVGQVHTRYGIVIHEDADPQCSNLVNRMWLVRWPR